jgi:hypothetical protein
MAPHALPASPTYQHPNVSALTEPLSRGLYHHPLELPVMAKLRNWDKYNVSFILKGA